MRGSGAEFVYLFAFEINMQVRLARTMRQQNFDPPIKIGPDVTRAKIIDVIDNQIERSDGGGIEPEHTVGEVIPCFVMVEVVDQKWVRKHPASGYECELGQKINF